jgi:hypothetical protein
MINYIQTANNSLTPEACNLLIDIFENNPEYHERLDRDRRPNFTQLNFTRNIHLDPDLHDVLVNSAMMIFRQYGKSIRETAFWPKKFGFEEFRIKRYRGNSIDEFDTHTDATSLETSKRFIAFFWYLNDVEEGGETEFTSMGISIKPEQGKVIVFPPMWMFPHKGNKVIRGEKYLLSSYLHYGE